MGKQTEGDASSLLVSRSGIQVFLFPRESQHRSLWGLHNILGETIENELQNKQTELLTLDRSRVLRSCAHDGNVQPEISRKSLVVTHQNAQRIQ